MSAPDRPAPEAPQQPWSSTASADDLGRETARRAQLARDLLRPLTQEELDQIAAETERTPQAPRPVRRVGRPPKKKPEMPGIGRTRAQAQNRSKR